MNRFLSESYLDESAKLYTPPLGRCNLERKLKHLYYIYMRSLGAKAGSCGQKVCQNGLGTSTESFLGFVELFGVLSCWLRLQHTKVGKELPYGYSLTAEVTKGPKQGDHLTMAPGSQRSFCF